ncbi:MAG TPA: hypothetical protein ENK53_03545 [Thiotrichales bacterium]|nr:hypothetical protein [Thiotrichales bacterium]
MKQSRGMSMVEAIANVVIGFGVGVGTQILAFPLFGIGIGARSHLALGGIFTVVSLVRSYALRRLFEHIRTRNR